MKLPLIFGLLISAGKNCVVTSNSDTLVALQLLIRHGNRTALSTFNEFLPWYIRTFEPFQFGQLTTNGRRQLLDTGLYIRQRYNYFLPEEFSYSEVQVKCTGMQRIMEASAVVMAAIFPPKDKQKWQRSGLGALYTPITCEYLPESQDILLEPDSVNCTRYLNLLNSVNNTPEYIERYNKLTSNGAVNNYIREALNFTEPFNQSDMHTLWDNLLGMDSYGLPLPAWSKSVYPQPLYSITQLGFYTLFQNPECIRFGAEQLLSRAGVEKLKQFFESEAVDSSYEMWDVGRATGIMRDRFCTAAVGLQTSRTKVIHFRDMLPAWLGYFETSPGHRDSRYKIGEFMKEILAVATLFEQDQPIPKMKKKLFAYIGHDNTIYPMLIALGFETSPPIVTYGAAFIMELHRNKTTKEIGYKFLYRNETWSEPIAYLVSGCQEICPLSFVKKKLEPYIPTKPFLEYC